MKKSTALSDYVQAMADFELYKQENQRLAKENTILIHQLVHADDEHNRLIKIEAMLMFCGFTIEQNDSGYWRMVYHGDSYLHYGRSLYFYPQLETEGEK
jgi:hypothetical protein